MKFEESGLSVDFTGAKSVFKPDDDGQVLPHGMSVVDFVVEFNDRLVFVEIKNPSVPTATVTAREKFARELHSHALINEHLVPKARDTYTIVHLMEQNVRNGVELPIDYVVLIVAPHLLAPELGAIRSKLESRLRKEMADSWKRPYIRRCKIVSDPSKTAPDFRAAPV